MQSKNSKARLELTQEDLAFILSYHQVIPSFLDLLFTCGRQERPREFRYAAFCHENYLEKESPATRNPNLMIESLGRSGRQIQHCYNLHSVECSGYMEEKDWSIRQTVVYHSFDVETGASFWIFIKGNNVIEKRIMDATRSTRNTGMTARSHQTLFGSFSASLLSHTQILEWCSEQWRWYINDMEECLRDQAKDTVLADVDDLAGPASVPAITRPGTLLIPSRTITRSSPTSPISPTSTFSKAWNPFSILSNATSKEEKSPAVSGLGIAHVFGTGRVVEEPEQIDNNGYDINNRSDHDLERMFSFEKLQNLHETGERMQETIMVLRQNRNIIREIREHYTALMENEEFPAGIREACKQEMSRFAHRALAIEKDLEVQQLRLKTLSQLLGDRISLVGLSHPHLTRLMKLTTHVSPTYLVLHSSTIRQHASQQAFREECPNAGGIYHGHDDRNAPHDQEDA